MDVSPDSPPPVDARAWRVHPAAEHPGRTVLVALILVLAGLACAVFARSTGVGLVAVGVLAASLRAYFLPTRYELTDDGASERAVWGDGRTIAWDDVRRVSVDPRGVVLSPRATVSRWLPERGVFLRTHGRAHRAAVLAEVEGRVDLTVAAPVTAPAR